MNLTSLANAVADKLDVPRRATKAIVEQFLEEIKSTLSREEPVYLHRFGQFYHTYQEFNEEYYRRHGALPRDDEGEELRVRICRFRFVKSLRESLNGICTHVGLSSTDRARLDYKTRPLIHRIPEIRSELEAERRARAGITLGEICDAINEEDHDEEAR